MLADNLQNLFQEFNLGFEGDVILTTLEWSK